MGAVHVISTQTIYRAEATIRLPPTTGEGSSTLAMLVEIEIPANTAGQYYETQSELLESPTIAVTSSAISVVSGACHRMHFGPRSA